MAKNIKNLPKSSSDLGVWIAVGLGFGFMFGLLMNNLAIGVGIGLVFGIAIGNMQNKPKI